MPIITDYASLVTELDGVAGWLHRGSLTARIPVFIQLCESDMQVRCKLVEFEASLAINVVAGIGVLPTDLVAMRSVYWSGNLSKPLRYVTPDMYDALRNSSATPDYYTITGLSIKVAPLATGSVVATYNARFTALDSTHTNSLITNFPDVYLYGVLYQAALYSEDDAKAQKYGTLFNAVIGRIKTNNQDRKYAGATLQVRAR